MFYITLIQDRYKVSAKGLFQGDYKGVAPLGLFTLGIFPPAQKSGQIKYFHY